jgi:hypothetical protein
MKISVRGWVDPRTIVLLEGLGKLKKLSDIIRNQTRDLPACSIAPQTTTLLCSSPTTRSLVNGNRASYFGIFESYSPSHMQICAHILKFRVFFYFKLFSTSLRCTIFFDLCGHHQVLNKFLLETVSLSSMHVIQKHAHFNAHMFCCTRLLLGYSC